MTFALGAAALIADSTRSMLPGRMVLIWFSAVLTALTQLLVDSSTQVSITFSKPTSLPPTVIDTSVVWLLRADSWPEMTLLVVAPAQATKTYENGWLALAHSAE